MTFLLLYECLLHLRTRFLLRGGQHQLHLGNWIRLSQNGDIPRFRKIIAQLIEMRTESSQALLLSSVRANRSFRGAVCQHWGHDFRNAQEVNLTGLPGSEADLNLRASIDVDFPSAANFTSMSLSTAHTFFSSTSVKSACHGYSVIHTRWKGRQC